MIQFQDLWTVDRPLRLPAATNPLNSKLSVDCRTALECVA